MKAARLPTRSLWFTAFYGLVLPLALLSPAPAQPAPPPGPPPSLDAPSTLMPSQRQPVLVGPEETNPFSQKVAPSTNLIFQEVETEEVRIRNIFGDMPFAGLAVGENSRRALIGPLALEEGDEVPRILPMQAERLVVLRVTDEEIELGFLERDGKVQGRTFTRRFSLAPQVRYLLPSEAPTVTPRIPGAPMQGRIIPSPDDATQE
ncbi:MAG: hypothetical protein Fur0032_15510 [Terrimicrobiaceae bacterium]